MPDDPNPTLARRRLAVRLSRARERNGRSLDELARELRVSIPQASRLDSGARGFKPDQVDQLSKWYDLGRTETDVLVGLVAESRRRAWWQQVDLPDAYRTLIGLESAAETINEFGASVIPGLLQTPEYARAAATGSSFDLSVENVEPAIRVRMRRQGLLADGQKPQLWVVVDESAVARVTGGPRVMSDQLDQLLVAARRPATTLQIIAFRAGTHPGSVHTHFILLHMGTGVPDVVYSEGQGDPFDTDDPAVVQRHRGVWDMLRALALGPAESLSLIRHYRDALSDEL